MVHRTALWPGKRNHLSIWGAIAAVLVFILLSTRAHTQLSYRFEQVALFIHPSAEKALAYGREHFDSRNHPELYNINAASYFFEKARQLDPNSSLVYYQKARIAFLRSDFTLALADINEHMRLHGANPPNAFYMRGLIEGFMGRYDDAIRDYESYLGYDPTNWAAHNDYAWIALRSGKPMAAFDKIEHGLMYFPDNAWLLNSKATALYELHRYREALQAARAASIAAQKVTQADWLVAYPGNDPKIAGQGIATLRNSIKNNIHTIENAIASSTVQSR